MAWIIHIFAILHALVALGCRSAGFDDQLLLTVLTIAMSLIICIRQGLKVEFTAIVVIVVNILGFLLGTLGADALRTMIRSEYVIHSLSTFITTEILGWCIMGVTKIFGQKEIHDQDIKSSPYMKWLLLIASSIFALRLLIVATLPDKGLEQDLVFGMVRKVMTNSFSLIILTCVNILFIRTITTRGESSSRAGTIALYATFMILATLLETFLVGPDDQNFMLMFFISMFVQITMYCIIYMINYAVTTRIQMQREKERASMAQYRYLKLKRQVNPHFLFNSLNILDCLICEEKSEQASTYTHKLASIYRYMIKSEDEDVVSLRDELVFVGLYTDLLKVRFPEGFEVIINVSEESMKRLVPPCSIQLLIENVTKHNAVSADNPLIIRIESIDDHVRISNNIVPKVTRSASTGLGQKYIRQLYMDMSGKAIDIEKTETDYSVTLPLL
ncbi:MAG: histidine kinase [Bacteroidales bacterium]|nr:histidine kinase [Bacteroidales bacterium]